VVSEESHFEFLEFLGDLLILMIQMTTIQNDVFHHKIVRIVFVHIGNDMIFLSNRFKKLKTIHFFHQKNMKNL